MCAWGRGAVVTFFHTWYRTTVYPVVFMYGAIMSTVVVLDNSEVSVTIIK